MKARQFIFFTQLLGRVEFIRYQDCKKLHQTNES